ncbi:hypothetical protein HMPREF1981_00782 [Bacteroides pyogenes F0041]|uniref:Uncharacterized protein n=1 Tax=Bacteroides pyogenes F0041 TaxID=1321819 RepID=U2C8E6_9BACE|nr:hypothetical protein HMPREF1981_00782 [Bacteroides pyogenes F0041]
MASAFIGLRDTAQEKAGRKLPVSDAKRLSRHRKNRVREV